MLVLAGKTGETSAVVHYPFSTSNVPLKFLTYLWVVSPLKKYELYICTETLNFTCTIL